ncbi:MAG: 8-amino-7-oxononanoate synthase [Candidatus Omnitrophota bacterium]
MERVEKLLKERKAKGLLRRLEPLSKRGRGRIRLQERDYLDFSSNDYLGLTNHPRLIEAAVKATQAWGTGSSASRLLSGDLNIHHDLESKVAAFKGKEAALVFNSGYQANVGIISAIVGRGDAIFSDRLNHASIIDGALLSGAKLFRYRHNDVNHLESLLKRERDKFKGVLILTESVFSMDGDRAPLKEIALLKERFGSLLMVDEAHATGIFGASGAGMVEEEGMIDKVDLIMGTFSKALGSFGGYIACDRRIKEYLVNFSRSFIYSTALPPSVIAVNSASIDLIKEEPFRRDRLIENSIYFRKGLVGRGFCVRGDSEIVPVILGGALRAVNLSKALQESGYHVLPIRPPTVPTGESRLRFSLNFDHTKEILDRVIDAIVGGI